MDRLTSISIKKQDSGLFTVNVRGYREGTGYHDKARRFTGVFTEDFEERFARALATRANRPIVEAFWNEEATEGESLTLEHLAKLLHLNDCSKQNQLEATTWNKHES
jgi:Lon protease-like protein